MTVHRPLDMPSGSIGSEGVVEQQMNGHGMPITVPLPVPIPMGYPHTIPTNHHSGHTNSPVSNPIIREVWADNLYEEFRTIRTLVKTYRHIAMDTEFPGVVARPIGEFRTTSDYQYQLLRANVDMLKLIQLGLTFMDEHGCLPPGVCTWQFNFKFNLHSEMYAQDSIDLLKNCGIQFDKNEIDGIDPMVFSELFITSGLVLNDQVTYMSFHSGYDFGYLIRLLTDKFMPKEEPEFFELLKLYFPHVYDIKYLMKSCKNLKGGLQEVADQLEIERIGQQHQAGSDSLLTGMVFFRMKDMFFEDYIDEGKYSGHLYGFGSSFVQQSDLTVYYNGPPHSNEHQASSSGAQHYN